MNAMEYLDTATGQLSVAEKGLNNQGKDHKTSMENAENTGSSSRSCDEEEITATDDNNTHSSPPVEKQRTIHGFRWFLVCFAVFSSNLLYGLDTTISADIQASVSATFNNDVTLLGWLGVGFGLGATVAILPLGQAFGIFDVKWLYIGCLVMFAAGSALCGGAPSMAALIVGRVWAGVGGAGMYLGTLNIFAALATAKEQAFYLGFEGFVYGGGCILGPIVGGLLADSSATWRWAFYLNLVIFAATSPVILFALPAIPQQADVSFRRKLARLDWLGILLNTGLYTSFTVALGLGGAVWSWHNDGRFIACIVVAAVALVAFALTQRFAVLTTTAHRLFPCDFVDDPELVLLYISIACGGASLFVAIYYIPLYFLFVHGDSGTAAAIRLLPFVAFYVTAILVCGYALPRVGYSWLWFLGSGLFLTAGGAAMYTVDMSSPTSYTYGFSLLLGLGLTSSMASYHVGASRVARADRIAAVIQFMNLAQGSSQMLGLLIASAVFQSEAYNGMKAVLGDQGYTEAQIRSAIAGAQSEVLNELDGELRQRCIEVIVATIQKEWILVMAAGAMLTVCSCFLSKSRF